MKRPVLSLMIILALLGVAFFTVAFAQVPPHMPGSICFTQQFWCWHQPPGPVGMQCGCPTPYGMVPGILG
jgi:hypothetical protein